ncbi:MAG: DedA family protein, partial [Bacteroidota bacterium]|nr:DedA family protein [Bacteroidota bacterium]
MHELFNSISGWYMEHINYGTITMLMAIESSFFPLPSEVVIPPAAWKSAAGELSIVLVVLCGTCGALLGSLFNYALGYFLGRKLIYSL